MLKTNEQKLNSKKTVLEVMVWMTVMVTLTAVGFWILFGLGRELDGISFGMPMVIILVTNLVWATVGIATVLLAIDLAHFKAGTEWTRIALPHEVVRYAVTGKVKGAQYA